MARLRACCTPPPPGPRASSAGAIPVRLRRRRRGAPNDGALGRLLFVVRAAVVVHSAASPVGGSRRCTQHVRSSKALYMGFMGRARNRLPAIGDASDNKHEIMKEETVLKTNG